MTEAAQRLGITRTTVRAAMQRGTIKSRRYQNGRRVPLLASVLAYGRKRQKMRTFQPTRPAPQLQMDGEPWSSEERLALMRWIAEQRDAGYLTGQRLEEVLALLREILLLDIELTASPEYADMPLPRKTQKAANKLLKALRQTQQQ